ncbi:MAG: arsenate reductase ArsC [Muribaculaceae bacterium]|nr:arsenate reductase ArsC [Muribaculaceae bacterium]
MKILILCTGNSCRSQMAQAFLASFDSSLEVFSAGTIPAEKLNPRAVAVMKEVNLNLSGYYPKGVKQYLNESWDYVITVCDNAKENCPIFSGDVKHRLHFGFDDPANVTGNEEYVMHEFRRIRNEIKSKFFSFYVEEIKKQQNLQQCQDEDK